jgi:hypothetical protein
LVTQNDTALKTNLEAHISPKAKADNAFANDATYCGAFTGDTGNSTQCIYGYFVQALVPPDKLPGGSGGGTNLGATAPYLTG